MRVILFFIFCAQITISSAQVTTLLIARNTGSKILANGQSVRTMGFAQKLSENPGVPGPTLIFFEGDSVTIDLWNISQGAPHTIHLHGLDVDQQNDGVPHLSFAVPHMEHGYYRFKAPHPGTYLYHCHVVSSIHVQAGMYGLLIVLPKDNPNHTWEDGYRYYKDYSFLFSEIDTVWHTDSVLIHSHDSFHQKVQIPDYNPQFFMINGWSDQQISSEIGNTFVRLDSTVLLRLANIGNYGTLLVFPERFNAVMIASDGRPLPKSFQSDSLLLYPGERYQVLIKNQEVGFDSIKVHYFNLNTRKTASTQYLSFITDQSAVLDPLPESGQLSLYPNPSDGSLSIKSVGNEEIREVEIYDNTGNLLFSDILSISQISYSNTELSFPAGIYIVKVRLKSGVIVFRWVVL